MASVPLFTMAMVEAPERASALAAVILTRGVAVSAPSWKVLLAPAVSVRPPKVRVPPLCVNSLPVLWISTAPEAEPVIPT